MDGWMDGWMDGCFDNPEINSGCSLASLTKGLRDGWMNE